MKLINIVKKYSYSILAISTLIVSSSFINQPQGEAQPENKIGINPYNKVKVICLDAGHGGNDAGALGSRSKEKDINLEVVLKLGKRIEEGLPGVKVVYTRKTDVFLPLHERPKVANRNKADIFISVHCNSANTARRKNPSAQGTETFFLGYSSSANQDVAIRENASILLEDNYQDNYEGFDPKDPSSYIVFKLLKRQYRAQSIQLASAMQNEFTAAGRKNRGVKEAPFAVLKSAAMPAVLTELGFMSSPTEEDYMLSSEGQAEIVNNLFDAIKKFKNIVEK